MEAGMDSKEVHERLLKLAAERGSMDYEEACLLAAARRLAVHVSFGYASLLEYVTRTLGLGAKVARERLRVAEALEDLPVIAAALRDGTVSWSVARELTRIAVRDTEMEWLAAAKDRTVRQVEDMISGALPGERPGDERHDEALSSLCAAHHTAVHEGRLIVEGKPSTGLTFRHADGTIYGKKPVPSTTANAADAFLALKTLGYKEKEARFAITKVLAHVGQAAGLEELIRRGLAALRRAE
jgi:hypothetical protein